MHEVPECAHEGCTALPYYARKGQAPRYCRSHAKLKHIHVVNSLCDTEGCDQQTAWGSAAEKRHACDDHKVEGMVRIKDPNMCQDVNCSKWPSYSFMKQRRQFCAVHKLDGMLTYRQQQKLLNKQVDALEGTCSAEEDLDEDMSLNSSTLTKYQQQQQQQMLTMQDLESLVTLQRTPLVHGMLQQLHHWLLMLHCRATLRMTQLAQIIICSLMA
jgi:ribosomal protein L30/L7E